MKTTLIILTLFATLSCCKKDDANDQLPPATQTGAGTFACKVNGQNFIDTSGGYFNCYYQFNDGDYYFGISAYDDDLLPGNIFFGTNKKEIFQGETINLIKNIEGNASGGGGFYLFNKLPGISYLY